MPATPQLSDSPVYHQPGFTPFLVSRLCAVFAMQIQAIVVAWQVYDITHDPLTLGYVGLAQFLPWWLYCYRPATWSTASTASASCS